MIIFDLDGTLANCEHRRHFVTPPENSKYIYTYSIPHGNGCILTGQWEDSEKKKWTPNWPAFYEDCDQDTPIEPVIEMWNNEITWGMVGQHQIWSGRCESVRKKTEKWLDEHILCFESSQLKMRPIGDNTPDDVLKERWLDEAISQGETIEFVFDDRKKVCRMWRRRGIFVFNCAQSDKEF